MSSDKDTLRDEYPEDLIRSGVRGKYVKAYREGTNVVLIDPDLHALFPNSKAVNRALRAYVSKKRNTRQQATRRRRA
jgi:hypothetical protein